MAICGSKRVTSLGWKQAPYVWSFRRLTLGEKVEVEEAPSASIHSASPEVLLKVLMVRVATEGEKCLRSRCACTACIHADTGMCRSIL